MFLLCVIGVESVVFSSSSLVAVICVVNVIVRFLFRWILGCRNSSRCDDFFAGGFFPWRQRFGGRSRVRRLLFLRAVFQVEAVSWLHVESELGVGKVVVVT